MKLYKKIIIKGEVELITGMHIGDSKDNVDIGGVDSPVVRRKDNNQPYIPGSSLKGKMRSLLDITHRMTDTTKSPDHKIGQLFGALSKDRNIDGIPSRLIVRDSYMTKDSVELFKNSEFTDLAFTEVKFENTINRVSGKADHPRQFERVPAGTKFNTEFIINVIAASDEDAVKLEKQHLDLFYAGIRLLEDDYIGGSGSRGYGQIKFTLQEPIHKLAEHYING